MSFEAPDFNNKPPESGPEQKERIVKIGIAEAAIILGVKPMNLLKMASEGLIERIDPRFPSERVFFNRGKILKYLDEFLEQRGKTAQGKSETVEEYFVRKKQEGEQKETGGTKAPEKKEPGPSIGKHSPEKVLELEKTRVEADIKGTNELRKKLNKELVDVYKDLWRGLSAEELDNLRAQLYEKAKKGEQGTIPLLKETAISQLKQEAEKHEGDFKK